MTNAANKTNKSGKTNKKLPLMTTWLLLMGMLIGSEAFAHARWNPDGVVKPRSTATDIKSGPCGEPRGSNPVVFSPGQTVEVEFEATIYHQGYFRIAFSPSNDADFDSYVLADNIPDYQGQRYRSYSITLPDMECTDCTLQLIQVMLDRNPPTNYYSCADIQLKSPNSSDTTPPAPVSNVLALPGDGKVDLMWTKPSDSDYAGTLVLRSLSPVQAQPIDGQSYSQDNSVGNGSVVFMGDAESLDLGSLINNQTYFFQIHAYDTSFNYSLPRSIEVSPQQNANVAPQVMLSVEQVDQSTAVVYVDDGDILLQANVVDQNSTDQHSFDWSASDTQLNGVAQNGNQWLIDPANLSPGTYRVVVDVWDNGNPPLSTRAEITLDVRERVQSTRGGAISFSALILIAIGIAGCLFYRRRKTI